MHGIQAVDHGAGVSIGMRGEFDAYSLPDLRETLDRVCAFGKPVAVDLSGVTFLDLQSARELVVRSLIQTSWLASCASRAPSTRRATLYTRPECSLTRVLKAPTSPRAARRARFRSAALTTQTPPASDKIRVAPCTVP